MTTEVFVFKTNIHGEQAPKMDGVFKMQSGIVAWNADLEDCDKVLRIEADGVTAQEIIELLKVEGFFCSELPG